MKWFKHESKAVKDEKIQMAMDSGGIDAYGLYFILCELCSEKIEIDHMVAKIEISSERLRGWSHIYHHKSLVNLLTILHNLSLIYVESIDNLSESKQNLIIISIPNLLKRLDNWTKRSLVATQQVSLDKEEDIRYKKENKISNTTNGSAIKTDQIQNLITDLSSQKAVGQSWRPAKKR